MKVSNLKDRLRSGTTASGTYPDCGPCEVADPINKVCLSTCGPDETCVNGSCESDGGGGGGGGTTCGPCYTKDPISGDCIYDCGLNESCVGGSCVPDDGGGCTKICGPCYSLNTSTCTCEYQCGAGEICSGGTCVDGGGGGGGPDSCGSCQEWDGINKRCVDLCASDEECVNGQCESTSQFDPSAVSISACSVSSEVQKEGQFDVNLSITNGNSTSADVSFSVQVGSNTVVSDSTSVGSNSTANLSYQRTAFLDAGDYSVSASIDTAAEAQSTTFRRVKQKTRFSVDHCGPDEVWDPINKKCIPVVDNPSCDCTADEVCIDGECVPTESDCGGCPEGMVCDPVLGECVDDTSCTSDADCGETGRCVDGTCIYDPDPGNGGWVDVGGVVLPVLAVAATGGYYLTQR